MIKTPNEKQRLLLTCREAAYACGVDPKTWRMWDGLGIVPQPVRLHKSVFWRRLELIQWVEEDCPRRKDWVWRPNKKYAEIYSIFPK